jgi:hypothetical protein
VDQAKAANAHDLPIAAIASVGATRETTIEDGVEVTRFALTLLSV